MVQAGRIENAPVSNGHDHTPVARLCDGVHAAFDFWCGGDDTHAGFIADVRLHEPVLVIGQVLRAVCVFERDKALGSSTDEGESVSALFRWLNERTFCVPPKEVSRVGGRVRPK